MVRFPWFVVSIGCALAWTAPAAAQPAGALVSGTVIDAAGDPLPAAQVFIRSIGRELQTDAQGRFAITLPAGRHVIQFALVGYAAHREEIVVAGQSLTLVTKLAVSPLSLPGVQVTATTGGSDPRAVTQATTQLSGKQLERELASTIAQTLRSQPGIAVRFMGPAAAMPVMRGLTGDRILVLQDGLRSADLSGSADDHGVTIDPLSAQRIEVVRGPATLLYGNNALGGVVNIISASIPAHIPSRTEWSVAAHSESAFPGGAGNVKAVVRLSDRFAANVSAGGRTSADMRIGDDPVLGSRLPNSHMRNWNGSAALGFVADDATAGVLVKGYDFAYGLPVPPGAGPVSLRGRRYELTARGELNRPVGPLSSVRADATAQDYLHDELDDVSRGILQTFALRTQTFNMLARHSGLGPVTEGAFGVSGLFKDYVATGSYALTPAAYSRGLGVFTFQELALRENGAALQFGARLDHYAIESVSSDKFGPGRARAFPAVSGSAGVMLPLSAAASGSFSVTRSFRAPTVEELFSNAAHAGTGAVEIGNPDLGAEHGVALEGVVRVQNARWNSQVSIYRNTVNDYVLLKARGDTVIGGVTLPVLSYAQSRAVLQGAEGSIELALSSAVAVSLIGDYLHAQQADGTPLSFMPPARLGTMVRWDNGRFSAGGDLHHEFRQDRVGAADELPTPAHSIVRLHAGVRFRAAKRHHSITIRGENMTNELHREATSRIKDFAPGAGRNIALSYRILF